MAFDDLELELRRAVRARQAQTPKAATARWGHPGRRWIGRALAIAILVVGVSAAALAATGVLPLAPASHRQLHVLGSDRTQALAAYRGKPLLVTFYGSWCAPCREQARVIDRYARTLRANGTGNAVLIDDEDTEAQAKRWAASVGLTLPVLEDRTSSVVKAYRVVALPWTFVLDAKGRLVASHPGGGMTRRDLEALIAQAQASG